jgi:hypothetical protein
LKPNLFHQIFTLDNFTNVPKFEDFETLGTRPVQGDVRNSQGDVRNGQCDATLGKARDVRNGHGDVRNSQGSAQWYE